MQNEKVHLYQCIVFEHNLDFEIVFWKSDDVFLVYDVLDKNVFLDIVDVNKFLLLVCLYV